ncbi:MAG: methyltransferase domain-containing protein [Candidatus Pacearchaeota archaeon]|nr:methyltransferase domain-containing protein [Candidatus Pacearchaeota archaeon]
MNLDKKRQRLKDVLKDDKNFTEKELKILPRSFDIIGEIIIIQIPHELEKKEKIIAESLLKQHNNIKTIYAKGKFYGRLRKPKLRWIVGKKISETVYKEAGCFFKMDVKTCFFSPRLSTDRLEIAKMSKKGENVLVMFSGVAPYGIVIAKNSHVRRVVCVEISKEASEYARENVRLNRLINVEIIQGDVKRICPFLKKKKDFFDRIIMGRPQLKDTFLKETFMIVKKGTIVHFQDFINEQDMKKGIHIKRVLDAAKKAKRKVEIHSTKIIRELAPYKYHVRVDFKVLN